MPIAKVHPREFREAAKRACETKLANAKAAYPRVKEENLPFLCMDLVYQYTLLVEGFGRLNSLFCRLCKFDDILYKIEEQIFIYFLFLFLVQV